MDKYPKSIVQHGVCTYALVNEGAKKLLAIQGDVSGFEGGVPGPDKTSLFPLSPANAAGLRSRLPWLNPQPLGLRPSAGTGDRLGLATPGHARAATAYPIAPIFAQQSVRENARTGRTPQQVMDDAMWGLFQEGWRAPWGADADHLKRKEDVPAFVDAGYTFFTVDPGDAVQKIPPGVSRSDLERQAARLDWPALSSSLGEMRREYLGRSFPLRRLTLKFNERDLLGCLVKYGGAVAHTAQLYSVIRSLKGETRFDFEVSIDETDEPTSALEHFWIASQLQRLGVNWVSLAPRFVGRFEKGVDYIGDILQFEAELAKHAAILDYFDSYKLSLHSGSDKFSIYPSVACWCSGRVHLKTAGTSYLEALRVMAARRPDFFRKLLELSRQRYPIDRASYHVSAVLENVPLAETAADADLPGLLEQFDTRQVLHVCFGAMLDAHGPELKKALFEEEEAYSAGLERHFGRHFSALFPPAGAEFPA